MTPGTSSAAAAKIAGMFDEYIVDREEYVGLGSGAFSYLQGSLYVSTFSLREYRDRIAAGKTGMVRRRAFSERDQVRYYLLMQLFGGELDRSVAEAIVMATEVNEQQRDQVGTVPPVPPPTSLG